MIDIKVGTFTLQHDGCAHEEKGQIKVSQGSPCEDKLDGVVDELELSGYQYII